MNDFGKMLDDMRKMARITTEVHDEQARNLAKHSTLFGMKIITSPLVGPNEIAFLVGSEVMGRIINIGNETKVDPGNVTGDKEPPVA